MTRRRFQIGLLIGLIVLASCVPTPNPEEYDWCYYYNFSIFDYGAVITNGEWVDGEGIVSDSLDPNAIVFSITRDDALPVQPGLVSLTVARPDGVTGEIVASGSANIYETTASIPSTTLASDWTEETIWAANPDGDYGNLLYVEIQSDQPLAVTGISVHGNGPTPFDQNPCAPPTPTHTGTATGEATATLTPSITPTPTNTLTPSPTPTTWEWEWNNEDGQCGFTIRTTGYGEWDSGGGTGFKRVSNTSDPDGIYIIKSDTLITTATTFTYWYLRLSAASSGVYESRFYAFGGYSPSDVLLSSVFGGGITGKEWTTSQTFEGYAGVGFDPRFGAVHPNGMWAIERVVFRGTGLNPFAGEDCTEATATPTPTATNTATNTPTPTPTRTPLLGPGTPTPTRTIPAVNSPTPRPHSPTPPITNTPGPTNTPPPTTTLIPLPSAVASQTIEATYPVPEFTGTFQVTQASTLEGFPTLDAIDEHSEVYNLLSTAAAELENLPSDFEQYIPNPNIVPMMGYIKWGLSCVSLYEVLGETVGTFFCHASVGLILLVIMTVVWISVTIIMFIMRLIFKIITFIMGFIPGM